MRYTLILPIIVMSLGLARDVAGQAPSTSPEARQEILNCQLTLPHAIN